MPNLYALAVGIDNYPNPDHRLEGCVNDATGFVRVLTEHYNVPPEQVLTLTDSQATRAAVIQSFREHLGKAQAGDIAVFFYAGHGSQEETSPQFLAIEPDGKNETLVCYDSRQPGNHFDLTDKDIAVLIQEIAAKGAKLTLILDCCHSQSADRGVDSVGSAVRSGVRRIADRRVGQPDSAYLRPPAEIAAARRNMPAADGASGTSQALGFVKGVGGAHIIFAACSDFQLANEYRTATPKHGAFTWCLLQVLQEGRPLSNDELYRRTSSLLRGIFPNQQPHLGVVGGDHLRTSQFLGTGAAERSDFFIARCSQNTWTIDGGGLHSLGAGDALALYPANAAAGDLADRSKALTTAKILQAGPSNSTLAIAEPVTLNPQQIYKAVVTARGSRMRIALDGDAAASGPLRDALASSTWLQEGAPARFTVHAAAGAYQISVTDAARPVPGPFEATAQGVSAALAALEHMAQWTARVELNNPFSQLANDAVDVAVSYYDSANQLQERFVPPLQSLNLQYRRDNPPSFRLRVTNRGSKQVYVAILACSSDWEIDTSLLADECTMLDTTQELFAADGSEIPMDLEPGVTESRDHIVVVISTQWFDASAFALPSLTAPQTRGFGRPTLQAPPALPGDFTVRHFEIATRR